MENPLLILYFLIYLFAALTIGLGIIKFFKFNFLNRVEKTVFSFALGSLFYSYVFIFLGFFHLLYKQILLVVYLAPTVILIFINAYKKHPKTQGMVIRNKFSYLDWLLVFALVFIFFPIIPKLFLYPTSWDPLAYHLALPKLYLREHAFHFYYYYSQTAFPIGIESLYGFGEIFKDARFGNLLNFTFLFTIVAYLLYGLDYLFEKRVLILAAFLFLLRPFIYSELSITPFIDFGFTFFCLVLSITLIKFIQTKKTHWLILSGVLALYLPMIKFSGIVISGTLIIVLVFYFFRNMAGIKNKFSILKKERTKYLIAILIVLLPLIYWFSRNYIYAHNPVYPFLMEFFKGLNYNPANRSSLLQVVRDQNRFYASIMSNILHRVDNATDYSNLSDVFTYIMIILISLFSIFKYKNFIRYLSLFAFLSIIIISLLIGPLMRYYMPLLPVLALITAYCFYYSLDKLKKNFSYMLIIALITITFFTQIDSTFYQRTQFYTQGPKLLNYSYFNYSFDKASLFAQDNYRAIDYVNTHLDKNKDRVLILFDNRLYYFDIPVEFDEPTISGYFTNPKLNTADKVYQAMKKEKITYIVINTRWGITPALKIKLYKTFVNKYLRKVYSEKNPDGSLALGVFKLK